MIENTREIYESLYPRIFNQHYGMCPKEFNRPFDYFAGYDYLVSIIEEKNKEIKRLNNVINKASKKLEATLNCLKDYMFENKEYCKIHTDYIYALEDGIKELKGVDKE